ncbi:uncharacterized protein A4U43_C05F7830 [Asparagus officinalis]|uniref:Uncharacterized protein n=1 Tax=Asparagus officinalis TaxID=4686 RepID=A0A5P1ESP6_ASPOF|nr:uncharacterized protein A4U43_C05F7830 [Asparagus officinalis]
MNGMEAIKMLDLKEDEADLTDAQKLSGSKHKGSWTVSGEGPSGSTEPTWEGDAVEVAIPSLDQEVEEGRGGEMVEFEPTEVQPQKLTELAHREGKESVVGELATEEPIAEGSAEVEVSAFQEDDIGWPFTHRISDVSTNEWVGEYEEARSEPELTPQPTPTTVAAAPVAIAPTAAVP